MQQLFETPEMSNSLVYLRPATLAYVRAIGPYDKSIEDAWDRMYAWVDENGLNVSELRGYGLARDNPTVVDPDKCRYDACILTMPEFEDRALRELGTITLPGGPYARKREVASRESIHAMVATIHTTYEAPNDLKIDDRRPIVTIYLEAPLKAGDSDRRIDLCVPVMVVSGSDRAGSSKSRAAA